MQYHIQTAPVWDAYRESDGCPLCAIYEAKQKRLIKAYLNENVMDPHFRERSNAFGFCAEHSGMLYEGENKLGLALQLETRAAYLGSLLKSPPVDKKAAKKTADKLSACRGCVICSELEDFMPRYYMTIAQMFSAEKDFSELFASAKHCFKHAIALLYSAEHAGKNIAAFAAALCNGLKAELDGTEADLRAFADCFDHKSSDRPNPQSIPRALRLLTSKKI